MLQMHGLGRVSAVWGVLMCRTHQFVNELRHVTFLVLMIVHRNRRDFSFCTRANHHGTLRNHCYRAQLLTHGPHVRALTYCYNYS
jgi:hypothetical protein